MILPPFVLCIFEIASKLQCFENQWSYTYVQKTKEKNQLAQDVAKQRLYAASDLQGVPRHPHFQPAFHGFGGFEQLFAGNLSLQIRAERLSSRKKAEGNFNNRGRDVCLHRAVYGILLLCQLVYLFLHFRVFLMLSMFINNE